MTKHGYLMFNYGNDKYFQDTALKRYTRYHDGGSTWIFNSFLGGDQGYGSCGCGCSNTYGWGSSWSYGSHWGCVCGNSSFSWKNFLGAGVGALCVGLAFKGIQSLCNGGWDKVKGWFKKKPVDKTEKPETKPEVKPETKPETKSEVKTEVVDGVTPPVKPTEPTENQVKIGDKIIDIASITLDDIPETEINNLDKTKVDKILTKLGYLANGVGKMSNDYKVLLLLQRSGVTVEVEHRGASQDQWVKGPISNVTKDSSGKLSYTVDCDNVAGASIEGKYIFTATDNTNKKFTAKSAEDNPSYTVDETIELEYQDEKQPLLNKSDRPLVKRK